MITGDKLETAENIAHSAGIFQFGMKTFHIKDINPEKFPKFIINLKKEIQKIRGKWKKGIVMDMRFMNFVFEKINNCRNSKIPSEYKMFQDILMDAESVVWARSTPKQKASIVKFVKDQGKITLSIGDGANDVNMLGVANIGIGLYGEEGLQAVQASDVAISEFKYLWKLIFVYGRLNYLRVSKFVYFFLYKNYLLSLPQFIYGYLNFFSWKPIWDGQYQSAYNLIFTWALITYLACCDFDIKYYYVMSEEQWKKEKDSITEEIVNDGSQINSTRVKVLKHIKDNYHYLYYVSQRGLAFNWRMFGLELTNSTIQATVICIICYN